ncbi:hypothetical protein A3C59_04345 [Candidatus Daviesbacteria bacterium RIFCSPHIGHO2_02_FULL_36_13]|uniref:N-acetyltransferase domain-containing protein n=1 Tax=Candidatus Daviesbacteria bacterium RIFCSPHIGHO2_02_FULL_36_13 TaxID=1797768 RepID=A0A1F5JW10_9BACT|nr:MAG: hypothetical protein A3C59_04345 [Candidatus Daviesbacteria bacterium RIFCSPHIGHO2_02_FULL_36_13]
MDELVIKAAQNNADWCDVVCRTHGVPGEFLENVWINQHEVPAYYPNAVTIKPLSNNDVTDALKKISLEAYAIKDSFNELNEDEIGCKILFEAEWISYSQDESKRKSTIDNWTIIKNDEELKNWERVWNNANPTDKKIFLPNILSSEGVFFLAKYKDNQIVAGGIVNISHDVVGLSNVFTKGLVNSNIYSELVSFIKEKISTIPIVGYEKDKELELAHEAGFKTIGKLKVLLKI